MKKALFAFLAVFFLSTSIAAAGCGHCPAGSGKDGKGDWMAKKLETMTSSLGLNEDQQAQVKAALEAKKAKKEAIKAQKEAIHEEFHTSMKSILTPEQQEKFEEMKENWGKKGSKKGSGKGHDHDHGSGHEHKGSH